MIISGAYIAHSERVASMLDYLSFTKTTHTVAVINTLGNLYSCIFRLLHIHNAVLYFQASAYT